MAAEPARPPRRLRNWLIGFVVLLVAAVFGLEFALRTLLATPGLPTPERVAELATAARAEAGDWRVDPDLGRVPVLAPRSLYGEFGLRQGWRTRGNVTTKRDGVVRLLHLGDGVTARAAVLQPLRELWRGGDVEFLNAGVPGFDPAASVAFYRQHQRDLAPDRVVVWLRAAALTTPLAGCVEGDEFVLCAPGFRAPVDPDWYASSALYRRWALRGWEPDAGVTAAALQRAGAALARLRDDLAERAVPLAVVLLPDRGAGAGRSGLVGVLGQLGIDYLDLQPVADELNARSPVFTAPAPERPGDPPPTLAAMLARAAAERLLPETPVRVLAMPRVVGPGDAQQVVVEAPPEFAGRRVILLGSAAGITPAADLGRGRVPLRSDEYLTRTAARANPPFAQALDGDGKATFTVPVPGDVAGPAVVWHCPVVCDRRSVHFELIGWPAPMIVRAPE